jgi:hypothetical protein
MVFQFFHFQFLRKRSGQFLSFLSIFVSKFSPKVKIDFHENVKTKFFVSTLVASVSSLKGWLWNYCTYLSCLVDKILVCVYNKSWSYCWSWSSLNHWTGAAEILSQAWLQVCTELFSVEPGTEDFLSHYLYLPI